MAAVTQIAGVNDKHTDLFELRRLNIGHGHTPQLFVAQVSGFWPWMRSLMVRRTRDAVVSDKLTVFSSQSSVAPGDN
jgi:hypothetical protein